jgi:NTE family protein
MPAATRPRAQIPSPSAGASEPVKTVNLALQGGGAHGAFTWGALDRLLEDQRLAIEGISGTSAGAINGAVLAQGYAKSGRAGARAALDGFWDQVSQTGRFSPLGRTPLDWLAKTWGHGVSPSFLLFDGLTRFLSPYQLNPFNWHPLREILEDAIDFKALEDPSGIKLFISATNVRSGKNRIFTHDEVSVDVLLASACLPFLYQAVEIDGEPYWDGGYMGNPAIYPLIYHCAAPDIVILQVNPLTREALPKTAPEILDRVNEISFNSTLMREMRAIAFVTKLIDRGALDAKDYKRLNIHMIGAEDEMSRLGVDSKLNTGRDFLAGLRELDAHFDDIGKRPSIDIGEMFF